MACKMCFAYYGKHVDHGTRGCNLASSVQCRKCHTRGHLASSCTILEPSQEYPMEFEEFIPAHLRTGYGIRTHTPITMSHRTYDDTDTVTIEGTSHFKMYSSNEMPEGYGIRTIIAPDPSDYKALGDFIKLYNIDDGRITKNSCSARLAAINSWAMSYGYRIVHNITS